MNKMIILLTALLLIRLVSGTVDLNLSELEYLSNHLRPEECRKLVAALHFRSYNRPNALDAAERKISEDIDCLKLLLHWNSMKGEGLGESHEIVVRRLVQIGRKDLAEWLGKTVFRELGHDLERSLENTFDEIISSTENVQEMPTVTFQPEVDAEDLNAWIPLDTICSVLIVALTAATLALLIRAIYLHCTQKVKLKVKPVKVNKKHKKYKKFNDQSTTGSESEELYDIRNASDPAMKLLGV